MAATMISKPPKISPEIIAAFRRARNCDEGEYNAACVALHVLLKRQPHEEDVMDIGTDDPPDYIKRCGWADVQNPVTWAKARKLRLELEAAAG